MKDKSVYTELREDVFEDMKEKGLLLVSKYLRLEPYPRNAGVYGFSGWDRNSIGNRYRVYEGNYEYKSVFLSTWYAQFLGEVLFRFATVRSDWHKPPGGGAYRKYIVEVSIDGRSELLYFVPANRAKTFTEKHIRTMIDEDCHEYVWRLHKGTFGEGEYNMDCFYHDIDLEPISPKRLSEDKLHILSFEPGDKIDWDTTPPSHDLDSKTRKLLNDDRVSSTVSFLKEKIIPRMTHRPEESDYLSFLTELAGLSLTDAKTVTEHRGYYRLP